MTLFRADNPIRDVCRARQLILQFGWNAVAYQILNPGISHWFSSSVEGVIGYVRRGKYLVVAGAPICSAEHIGVVATEFETAARAEHCHVCYFGAGERLYENCRTPPIHSIITLGAQPVWNPADWPYILARKASLRAQLNRARNKGIVVEERAAAKASDDPTLRRCLDEWIASRHMPAMHFLVEPETLSLLEDRRLFVATMPLDGMARPVAYLIASPIPTRNGWLIEQIIRGTSAPNGTSECLLDMAVRSLHASGASYVTLGLVPLARHAIPAALLRNPLWLQLLLGWVRAHGRRFYNFDGLEAFKSKFDPGEWEPIFAIVNEHRFTYRALYAIAAAFSHKASPVRHGARTLAAAATEECRRIRRWF